MFACAAPVAHGDTVYVTNNFGSSVSQYGVGAGGALAPKATPTVAAGTNPIAIVVSPDGRSVYVANNGSASVSQYTVRDDGTLAAKSPATVSAGTGPSAIAITPDGKSVYVTNASDASISQYDVGTDGTLTAKDPATVAAGAIPFGVAVSPDGTSAYVAESNMSGTVRQYDIGSDGTLVAKTPATVAAGMNPIGVAVSPDGASVYVANAGGGNISQYDVGASGLLTAKLTATVASGQSPYRLVVSSDGTSVYATNQGNASNSVSQYDVGLGGALAPKSPAAVSAGTTPRGIALSTDGKSAYVPNVNSANVSQYDVGAGGALAAKSSPVVAAGSGADAVAVTPVSGSGGPPGGGPGSQIPTLFDTVITSGPSGLTPTLPTFTFETRIANATFECRFDNRAFRPCTSPHTGYNLSRGPHTFEVRYVEPDGTRDPTPASRSFELGVVTTDLSCTRLIPWDWRLRFDANPLAEDCDIYKGRCPATSRCTLTASGRVHDADVKMAWGLGVHVAVLPQEASGWCNSATYRQWFGHYDPCPARASTSAIGPSNLVWAHCSPIPHTSSQSADTRQGPDDERYFTCTGRLRGEPASNLGTNLGPGGLQVFLAGAGRLTVGPAGAGGARATGAGRRAAPFKTLTKRVRRAGRVTVKLKLSRGAARTLRSKRALRLRVRLAFKPASGRTAVRTTRLTLRRPPPCPKAARPVCRAASR